MSLAALGTIGVLSSLVPGLSRLLKSDTSTHDVLHQVAQCAQEITGEKDPEKIAHVFQNNPQMITSLYRELAKIETLTLQDRRDARVRDKVVIKTVGYNVRADVMVIAAALGLSGCLIALAYYKDHLPGEAIGIISTIAGIFGSCLKDAYGFEFGSSRGSKTKDEHVAAVLRGLS